MKEIIQERLANGLLRALTPDAFATIADKLQPVDLPARFKLADPRRECDAVFFPESGIASIIGQVGEVWQEIGLFGRDGAGCISVVLGKRKFLYQIVMQVGGHGYRISADDMTKAFIAHENVRDVVLRYFHTAYVQVSQNALANTQLNLEQRLARWLLMIHDRIDGDTINLTHEYLAVMLGVGRTTVTLASHSLERARFIRRGRGEITITDRLGMEKLVATLYGIPESDYRRLFGPQVQRAGIEVATATGA